MARSVRPPAVAGSFYPSSPDALRSDIAGYLDGAGRSLAGEPAPKAIIAPHAGYRYSGPVAATAYARLAPARRHRAPRAARRTRPSGLPRWCRRAVRGIVRHAPR